METKGSIVITVKRVLVVMMIAVVVFVEAAQVVEGHDQEVANSPASKRCYQDCYGKCRIRKPLFCATLCLSKCKHSKSIPDNLCNCTYSCSKFRCANIDFTGTYTYLLYFFNFLLRLLNYKC